MDAVRVVYIMGVGRSGSTALDTLLGNLPGTRSFGELAALDRASWRDGELCACGERGTECAFWSAVRARWESEGGDLERYGALRHSYERIRGLPRLLLARRLGTGRYREYERMTAALLRAIRDESGGGVVVDSSKLPARALALSGVAGVDVFLLHLVRDARGVAWSLAKSFDEDPRAGVERALPARSVRRSALAWTLVNRLADAVRRSRPSGRQALVRYEDYVAEPIHALEPLAPFVECDVAAFAREVALGRELDVGHTIAGNRLRMRGRIRLVQDEDWRERMPAGDRRRVWRLARGTLRRFGYAR